LLEKREGEKQREMQEKTMDLPVVSLDINKLVYYTGFIESKDD